MKSVFLHSRQKLKKSRIMHQTLFPRPFYSLQHREAPGVISVKGSGAHVVSKHRRVWTQLCGPAWNPLLLRVSGKHAGWHPSSYTQPRKQTVGSQQRPPQATGSGSSCLCWKPEHAIFLLWKQDAGVWVCMSVCVSQTLGNSLNPGHYFPSHMWIWGNISSQGNFKRLGRKLQKIMNVKAICKS